MQHDLISGSFGAVFGSGRITPGASVRVLTRLDGKERPWMLKADTEISYIVNGCRWSSSNVVLSSETFKITKKILPSLVNGEQNSSIFLLIADSLIFVIFNKNSFTVLFFMTFDANNHVQLN